MRIGGRVNGVRKVPFFNSGLANPTVRDLVGHASVEPSGAR